MALHLVIFEIMINCSLKTIANEYSLDVRKSEMDETTLINRSSNIERLSKEFSHIVYCGRR